jgi:GT2 family glycosyltransferase
MMQQERWAVTSIELNEALPELCCPEAYDGVRVVFFWNGVPVGHSLLSRPQLPLSSRQLAAVASQASCLAIGDSLLREGFASALPGLKEPVLSDSTAVLARLAQIEQPLSLLARPARRPTPQPNSTISVAVCTRERPRELARCLASLERLSEPPKEILVIDNAPESDATREVVRRFPGVTYFREPRAGLSAARNAALALASGEIVAFADDDVVVHPEWTRRLRGCFEDRKVMVATGLVLPAELETRAQQIFEEGLQFFHQGYRPRRFDSAYFQALRHKGVPVWSIGAGANMAIRRAAFDLGYKFDTRLGPGVFGGCGEDSEFWYRILAGGWSCVYEPAACVFHFHRRELPALRRLVREYMKGHVAALILQFAGSRDAGNLRRLFLRLPAEYVILLLRTIVSGFSLDHRILLRGMLGCFAGLRFVFSCRREPPDLPAYEPTYCRTDLSRPPAA